MEKITFRQVQPKDWERVAEIEAICFPKAEAAPKKSFKERIAAFPEWFLVAESNGALVGFINGCLTNSPVIYDEMFYTTEHHIPEGKSAAIFGLDVIPEYRRNGIAAELMKQYIQLARSKNKETIILTCKEQLVHYYEAFGYQNRGISQSAHGGARWIDMELVL